MVSSEDFEKAKPYIEAALQYNFGTQDLADVKRRLDSGQFQLVLGSKSAAVTEINQLPNKTFVNIVLAGGDLGELKTIANTIELAAKAIKASGVTIVGRRGWGRALTGYKEAATVYVKEL